MPGLSLATPVPEHSSQLPDPSLTLTHPAQPSVGTLQVSQTTGPVLGPRVVSGVAPN